MAIACSATLYPFPCSAFGRLNPSRRSPPPPIFISTNPSNVDPLRLRALLAAANYSCHRFPALSPDGRAQPADLDKLRRALAHSSIVVSVFCWPRLLTEKDAYGTRGDKVSPFLMETLFERVVPPLEQDRQLVGFGRAVSDGGLTASIHDVVVLPSLQRRGIGRKIVAQITRILTSRGIYDISALCSENERLFFKACDFGEDCLGSTTMMYTRTTSNYLNSNQVAPAGRMLLVVPPARQ